MCQIQDCQLLKLKTDLGLEVVDKELNVATFNERRDIFEGYEPLIVSRLDDGFRGRMFFRDVYLCDTLENPDTIIPCGTYPLEVTYSPKFRKFLPELKNVQSRSGIRIHMGNWIKDSSGCILVGVAKDNTLQYSVITLDRIIYNIRSLNIRYIKII